MKTVKKISLGLILLSVSTLAVLVFAAPKKAAADTTPTKADLKAGTYKFQDGANIAGTFSFSSAPIIFTDSNSSDSTRNYTPPKDILCDPGDIPDQNGLNGKMKFGINISSTADLTKATISGQAKLAFLVGSNCDKANAVLVNVTIQNPNQLAATDYQWDSDNIVTLNGSSDSATFYPLSNTNGLLYGTSKGGDCSGEVILLNTAKGNSGRLYVISNTFGSKPLTGTAIDKYYDNSCNLLSGPANVTIAGTAGQAAAGGSGTTTAAGDSCALDSGGFSLAWFMCPLLQAANDLVNGSSGHGGLLGMFEDQLSFNVSRDLGVVGGGGNQVQTTWSLIKNIASAILVIIMLLMVFSQAISAGPFDAYTIRKILPRLVAAVILMQLSWYIVAFIVDLVDDIGNSLFDLLYAPFGGANQLDLGHLLSHANIGTGQAIIIDFVGLVGGIVLGLASLPTVLFLAFAAIVALFTALVVLIFRKIIIIFCLIFAPLAILAWILPGTQRYWKLWYDNFIKVLMMFPLIVGLIAAGHIFAYVVGTQGNGTFLNMIFIMVGVFGPLFVLPKTYKWGGQALSMAGGAIHSVGSRLQKSGEEPIKSWTRRQAQGRFAKKYRPKGAPGSTFFNRTANSLMGGRIIPTKYRAALLTQTGDKWNEERDAEAQALLKRKGEVAMKKGYETAVLTDDKTGFARWREDQDGNRLDENNQILYRKQANGTYTYEHGPNQGKEVEEQGDEVKERVDNYDQASKRTLRGVAAMKQMWVDIADQSENSHERKMAIRQLTATSSWPEIQGSLSRAGNKVIDTAAWADSITTSQEDYPRILRSRVDATPHIDNWAQRQLDAELEKNPDAKNWTEKQKKDFKSQMRVLYSIRDQMSNEDFQTQSEGYWQEVARVANLRYEADDSQGHKKGELTDEAKKIQEALRTRFKAIHDIGGTAPQQLLGHLIGGSVQGEVDRALGAGANVSEYVNPSRPVAGETNTKVMEKRLEVTVPSISDLNDPNTAQQYVRSLLVTVNDRGGRLTTGPVGQTLAEGLAHGTISPADKAEHIRLLTELRGRAAVDPTATAAYNQLIDDIHRAYDRRAQEITERAIAQGLTPQQIATEKANAESAANYEKAAFVKI